MSGTDHVVLTELHEGAESREFWEGIGGSSRLTYDSLLTG